MKSVLISAVDQLIIRIWNKITSGNFNNDICNDFKILLSTLKAEAKGLGCNEVFNNLMIISQTIEQKNVHQRKSLYAIYCDFLAVLIDEYIKIIDVK